MRKKIVAGVVLSVFCVSSALAQRSYSCALVPFVGVFYPWLAGAGATAWQKSSAITLYIVSPSTGGFTFQQVNDIVTSLSNWSNAAGTNLSITTSVVTSTPSSFASQYILVQIGDTSACGAGKIACTGAYYNPSTGYPTYSIVNVSSLIGANDITSIMAHEIGHTYIIADCPNSSGCSGTSLTIMDPDQVTYTSGTSPQCCDLDLIYAVTPQVPQGAYCTQ